MANCASVFLCFVVASVSIVCTIVLWCSVVESVSIVLLSTTKQRNTDAQLAIIIQWYYSRCFVVDRSWLVGTATDSPHWTSLNFFSLYYSYFNIQLIIYHVLFLCWKILKTLQLSKAPFPLLQDVVHNLAMRWRRRKRRWNFYFVPTCHSLSLSISLCNWIVSPVNYY